MALRFEAIVVDCHDTRRVAEFWAAVFGGPPVEGPDEVGDSWFEAGEGHPGMLFQPVPEAKTLKNRLHLDLRPDDQAEEVERLLGLGARHVDIGQGEQTWVVLQDVEGNEFCVLRAKPLHP